MDERFWKNCKESEEPNSQKTQFQASFGDQIGPTLIGLNFQPKKSLIAIHHWLQSNCAISEESERPKVDIMARNLILDPIWA